MSNNHLMSDANYEEVDGEILPPNPDNSFSMNDIDHREVGHTIARAYELFPDELTKEVFPSDDMAKAYRISRRLLELDDHDWPKNPVPKKNIPESNKEINSELINDGRVNFTYVGKFGDRLRAELNGRVITQKINPSDDTDARVEQIMNRLENILRNGVGRAVPKKKNKQ